MDDFEVLARWSGRVVVPAVPLVNRPELPIRSQSDGGGDAASVFSELVCPASEDVCRQEDFAGTEIERMLKMYQGRPPGNPAPAAFADVDYDATLQSTLEAARAARAAYGSLAPEVRSAFPNWQAVLDGMFVGSLVVRDGAVELREQPKPPSPSPASDPTLPGL